MRVPSIAVLILALGTGAAQAAALSSCLTCHGNPETADAASIALVRDFARDVHALAGLSCQDCHGGDADPALAQDPDSAMSKRAKPHPFVGAPERIEIPGLCGSCHSDPAFMKRYQPAARIDQEREYWTSRHGQALRRGDARVATCVDCHGVHGILRVDDPQTPVHPTHVAETCRTCHGSVERMAGYRRDDGTPLPIDQYALWRQSVHAAALLDRGDLSAPTCNDCHGNHGAAPPGLDSIAFVCGQCHGREAELFRASPKQRLLAEHEQMLRDAGSEGCAACHEAPDPPATLTGVRSFGECVTCHDRHAVLRPSVAMLAPLPATPCAFCHESKGPLGEQYPEAAAPSRNFAATRDALVARAPAGLTDDERFDWLVDRALELPTHTRATENGGHALRPEFARLYTKFRIGKRHFEYLDPVSGKPAVGRVRNCADCHASKPSAGEPIGARTSAYFLDRMSELTTLTARAEREVLRARRGGVQTREAADAIDQAVDAQVELQALVHSFSASPDGPFAAKQREGMAQAGTALDRGQKALAELGFRRKGLAGFLFFVVLTLVALGLKIRDLPRAGNG